MDDYDLLAAAADAELPVVANLDKMDLSLSCRRDATGGILANVAGNRATSDFMSDRSSSN